VIKPAIINPAKTVFRAKTNSENHRKTRVLLLQASKSSDSGMP